VTVVGIGVTVTDTGAGGGEFTVTVTFADFVGSATEVATILKLAGFGTAAGAV
jgi:hypothetical protein